MQAVPIDIHLSPPGARSCPPVYRNVDWPEGGVPSPIPRSPNEKRKEGVVPRIAM